MILSSKVSVSSITLHSLRYILLRLQQWYVILCLRLQMVSGTIFYTFKTIETEFRFYRKIHFIQILVRKELPTHGASAVPIHLYFSSKLFSVIIIIDKIFRSSFSHLLLSKNFSTFFQYLFPNWDYAVITSSHILSLSAFDTFSKLQT